jgi:rRNA-processing protein FCF1
MSNGYVLADTNSLVYAYRAGGAKLLDTYQEMAKAERRELAITKTVRDEIEKGPLNAELLRYIADKNIRILDNPQTEQRLRVGEITRKNAGEESIVENAKREHAAGRSTPVLSDDRYFASPQKMREAPGVQPAMPVVQTQTITADARLSGELSYRASSTAVELALAC